jgi:hypothetical protein
LVIIVGVVVVVVLIVVIGLVVVVVVVILLVTTPRDVSPTSKMLSNWSTFRPFESPLGVIGSSASAQPSEFKPR